MTSIALFAAFLLTSGHLRTETTEPTYQTEETTDPAYQTAPAAWGRTRGGTHSDRTEGFQGRYMFHYVPRHKTIFCGIDKNGVTRLARFSQALAFHEDSGWHGWRANNPPALNISREQVERDLNDTSWSKIVMLREPHARFLSAYISKCGFPAGTPPALANKHPPEDGGRSCIHGAVGADFRTFVSLVEKKGFAGNNHYIEQKDFCWGISQEKFHKVWEPLILERSAVHNGLNIQVCDKMLDLDKQFCSRQLNKFYPNVDDHDSHHKNAVGFIRKFYDRELWERVSRIYADDMALYQAAGGRLTTWKGLLKMNAADTQTVHIDPMRISSDSGDSSNSGDSGEIGDLDWFY